jgi:MIP family channel proteins
MDENVRKGLAELVGTFALTFVGGAAIIHGQAGLVGVAMAHGLTLAVMVSCLGHISGGHFNPAVTTGFLVTGRMAPAEAGTYVAAQVAGAIIAALLLVGLFPGAQDAYAGGQQLASGIPLWRGIGIELVLTFFLVFTVFATAVDEDGAFKMIAGFGIGIALAFSILAGGPLTGASLNPARSFGPALVTSLWKGHLVYWIGPLLGGALAALLYDRMLLRRR